MDRKKYKELKITHRFLSECGLDVPHELLISLSKMILEEEKRRLHKRLENMSDEDLAAMESKARHTIRVTTSDGLLIKSKTNLLTFQNVLLHIGLERVFTLHPHVGKTPVLVKDETRKRKKLSGYKSLAPGYFVYKSLVAADILKILHETDEALQLDFDIELI